MEVRVIKRRLEDLEMKRESIVQRAKEVEIGSDGTLSTVGRTEETKESRVYGFVTAVITSLLLYRA